MLMSGPHNSDPHGTRVNMTLYASNDHVGTPGNQHTRKSTHTICIPAVCVSRLPFAATSTMARTLGSDALQAVWSPVLTLPGAGGYSDMVRHCGFIQRCPVIARDSTSDAHLHDHSSCWWQPASQSGLSWSQGQLGSGKLLLLYEGPFDYHSTKGDITLATIRLTQAKTKVVKASPEISTGEFELTREVSGRVHRTSLQTFEMNCVKVDGCR